MSRHPKTLKTTRLILRQAQASDANALFHGYCGVANCARYLTRGVHTSTAQTARFLKTWCMQAWANGDDAFAWVIAERHTDVPIGIFLVMRMGDTAQIHFGIGERHWGQGLVVEAGLSAMEWLFEDGVLQQLTTVCDAHNLRSQRVLEKLGFQQVGVLQKHLVVPAFGPLARDGIAYSILAFEKRIPC